ncbi:TIGR02680 family protein [Paenibacillus alkaliterrae]|uniref:TIGR02680 family protein n=1 Tax=Paenibacillus alkaliterrae TaxID=320909 RepID=UPI001F1F13F8|nr:TIGR02680 family protein [Paenibacillus alkaliterrae]MCF2941685.1 TIGR02680 family protein [Paenibacillus alkaliterrae]
MNEGSGNVEGNEKEVKQGRWQMSRAGILNFWFYEDEEFALEDGRLVLRGTNGAGKSVTMQSFVPLVLDGDKRPSRLDPFGSKDRRIEYYLLGEKDEHSDRTGYLWLEFKHTGKEIYKTIGIGLRARRGVTAVGFWGFALEDGRRINKDFWLYDRVLELEGSGKFPLDRKTLEERIGSGGQVVQEQGAYRDLVNRVLFGFYDREAYTDLLQLLIQLRSPKLSKDVKPTAIYEILVQSLPPLHEEELRPLSEVMEDMDQLADRLDELKLHQAELEKLNRSYEQYNRYLAYQSGSRLLAAKAESDEVDRQVSGLSKQLQAALAEDAEAEAAQKAGRERAVSVETELELLGRSEAMEKQKELEQAEQSLKDTQLYADQTQKRLEAALRSKETARHAAEKAQAEMDEQLGNQLNGLEYLEELAGDMEFEHHGVYHRYWSPQPPEDAAFSAAWRKDLEEHRAQIEEAIALAEQERDAERSVREADKELGLMRAQRDQAERVMRASESAAEEALMHWKERLLEWKEGLGELQLGERAVQLMFEASAGLSYEQQAVETVLLPVKAEADVQTQALVVRKLEREQEVKRLLAEREQLEAAMREWQHSREPEPARSEERVRTRGGYGAGQGAPLYELCEFRAHLSAKEQAGIEQTLLAGGLLDAWIRPDGKVGQVKDRDDEVWITPIPMDWGYTLADVLKPAAAAESGVSEQRIEEALRSFAWGETFDPAAEQSQSGSILIGKDYYQYGSITGKVDVAERKAQYIGKEARKQFKLAEIERLKQEIALREDELASIGQAIDLITESIDAIRTEVKQFPLHEERHEALTAAWKSQYDASGRFRLYMEQESRMGDALRAKQEQWSRLKQALIAQTAKWTRLKDHSSLREAAQTAVRYQGELSQLLSDWRSYSQAAVGAARYKGEAAEHAERAEIEEERRDELLDKQYGFKVKVEQLRKLMDELGISDLYARISGLKTEKLEIAGVLERLVQARTALAERLGGLRQRQLHLAEQENEHAEKLMRSEQAFRAELALQLIPELQPSSDREYLGLPAAESGSREQLMRACKGLTAALEPSVSRSNKERLGGILQDHYNATKHLLGEYVIETEISEQGRITIMSMRDRTRPQKPAALLAEMNSLLVEQQNLLSEKDRELFEEIILRSVGKAIRQRIQRAELWMKTMNRLMAERDTSSGLKLQLQWLPKAAQTEQELNSDELVALLRRDAHLLHDDEVEQLITHFRSRIQWAKQGAAEERETLRKHLYDMLDYRSWFQFSLRYKKGDEAQYRELTDSRFNVLSGGEKAMSMYIPLFAATYSRYADAGPDAPKIISLDEAFAGVDDENIRDLFGLLSQMDFDYMMTSQVLWGCYDTVPKLGICEIYRPKDADYVTLFRYRWNGTTREYVPNENGQGESDG